MTAETSEAATPVPVFQKYMTPIVQVLGSADAPMSNDALDQAVAEQMRLGPEILNVLHDPEKSDVLEAHYRMAWARTYLKKIGLIHNPKRGTWELTERGRRTSQVDADEITRQVRAGAEPDQLSSELPDHIAEELLGICRGILAEGRIPQGDALDACYRRFRERFGPDVLKRLDGEQLLSTIHGRGTRDSMVYWLEFKDDADFPATFGSIAGRSALKFGIYQSTETREWVTGSPQAQRRVSTRDAIELVRGQRDQLVAGAEVLASFRDSADDPDYAELQRRIMVAAPELADTAWGHKYFSLLFPELLDDYHAIKYQKYHLIRLHKLPSDGRYENARFFAGIARQLSVPLTHLAAALNRRDGNPREYWRLETSDGAHPSEWPRMRDGGFASMPWSEVGTLADVECNTAGKEHVRQLVEERLGGQANVTPKTGDQLFHFATTASDGDIVVAMYRGTVFGIGQITGAYYYEAQDGPFAHRLPVTWRSVTEWKLPKPEAKPTIFARLDRYPANLVEVEHKLAAMLVDPPIIEPVPRPGPTLPAPKPLSELILRVQAALARKSQVILYGPPGTGKTYWADRTIQELAARSWHSTAYDNLSAEQRAQLSAEGAIEHCCFHPSYGYEDFLIGYRPVADNGLLTFQVKLGVFARLCARALARPDRHFFLLVDEINRGDIPRIFGELLMVLEKDKRGKPISVPLMEQPFIVPPNVFVVGTMNTADRSVALLDAALRRRFAFVELMPDPSTLGTTSVGGLPLGAWLGELNRRIVRHAGRDARNLQLGHSYLLRGGEAVSDVNRFVEILHDDILPLLQEYCYEDFTALEKMLGGTIVDRERQRVNEELFTPAHRSELIDALLIAFDQITATAAAASADDSGAKDSENEDASEDDA